MEQGIILDPVVLTNPTFICSILEDNMIGIAKEGFEQVEPIVYNIQNNLASILSDCIAPIKEGLKTKSLFRAVMVFSKLMITDEELFKQTHYYIERFINDKCGHIEDLYQLRNLPKSTDVGIIKVGSNMVTLRPNEFKRHLRGVTVSLEDTLIDLFTQSRRLIDDPKVSTIKI